MKFKKILTVILTIAALAAFSACGNDKPNKDTSDVKDPAKSVIESTDTEDKAQEAEKPLNNETVPDKSKEPAADTSESINVYYGWGASGDEEEYTATLYCPEGAEFDEDELKRSLENGSVMTVHVSDEENGYYAASQTHWHRDAYNNEPTSYPVIAQLYFDGKIDAKTAEFYSECSQEITPLGFKWNGYDVVLIDTTYTFTDYPVETEHFAGVEYDLKYWKTEEGTGKVLDLTTKALFGFEFTVGDDFTKEQCAWIMSELLGVDAGLKNPYLVTEETPEPVAEIEKNALIGTWTDRTSDWEDTYIFNADGTGCFIQGPEYDFEYSISGDTITLVYGEDDTETFKATVGDGKLTLVDKFNYEQSFEKIAEEAPEAAEESEAEAPEEVTEEVLPIVGTWTEKETGLDETFTFKADGTGEYSCLTDEGTYECTFTYDFLRSDYVNFYFSDDTEGGFQFTIEGNKMTIRNDYVWDLVYTKQ